MVTDLSERPFEELSELQKLIVKLDQEVLSSRIYMEELYKYLAKEEHRSISTIKDWIYGKRKYPCSILETLSKLIGAIERDNEDLEKRLSTGLIPVTDFPDPKYCQEELNFTSPTAMYKAIAEEVGLSYHEVYCYFKGQVTYGRKEVKDCLEKWLSQCKKGGLLDINLKYRGVKREEFLSLADIVVKEAGKFKSKKALAEDIANLEHINKKKVTVYHYLMGIRIFVPLNVYVYLQNMFQPYSSQQEYQEKDLLYRPHTDDYGFVEKVKERRIIQVKWLKEGSVLMTQNDHDPFT